MTKKTTTPRKPKTVKVKFLLSPTGQFGLGYSIGDEAELEAKKAQELIDAQYAEKVKEVTMIIYQTVDFESPEVLSLTDAKKQLKMEDLGSFDDAIIQDCIDAAVDEAESYTGTNIRQRKFIVKADVWLPQDFEFREQIISAITKLTYTTDDETVVKEDVDDGTDLTDFIELLPVDKYASVIHFKDEDDLPTLIENKTDALMVEVTVGYAVNKVPKGLLQGIKLLMHENYNIRNNIESKSFQTVAMRKLEPYKYYRK